MLILSVFIWETGLLENSAGRDRFSKRDTLNIFLEDLFFEDSDDVLPCNGFEPETVIPGKLEIVEDNEDIYLVRKKRKGRPRGLPYTN